MSDIWTLVVVALVYSLVFAVGEVARRGIPALGWWAVLVLPLSFVLTAANGWLVMVLWNMAVPSVFGLPPLTIIPAIALAWLAGLLFRGIAPRATYDVDRDTA